MIEELYDMTFMRRQVELLRSLAADLQPNVERYTIDDFEGGRDDVTAVLEELRTLETSDVWVPTPVWLPRRADTSRVQSALDRFYRNTNQVTPTNHLRFGEKLRDPQFLLNRLRGLNFRVPVHEGDPRFVIQYSIAKGIRLAKGQHPLPSQLGTTTSLASAARLLLVGDWGSGNPGALKLARQMASYLDPRRFPDIELHAIHLGDVYHAGLDFEYDRNFLSPWPVPPAHAGTVRSWCLPGNHDMYTGGHGFFGKVLTDSRFKAQKGSYFLLENTHWQIFGLDSAYDPRDAKGSRGDLYGEQAAWVAQTRALSVDRKCIVLSHHSPFSAFEEVHEGLHRQLQPIAERGDILAWFWGHEHRGAIYGPFNSIEWPVLLGNGGFPQLPTPPAPTPSIRSHSTDIDRDGFLLYQFGVLELQGSQCDFYLVDEDGRKGPVFNLA